MNKTRLLTLWQGNPSLMGSFEKDDSRAVYQNQNPRKSRDLGVKPLAFLKRIGCEVKLRLSRSELVGAQWDPGRTSRCRGRPFLVHESSITGDIGVGAHWDSGHLSRFADRPFPVARGRSPAVPVMSGTRHEVRRYRLLQGACDHSVLSFSLRSGSRARTAGCLPGPCPRPPHIPRSTMSAIFED
jgi:hypothetical protein